MSVQALMTANGVASNTYGARYSAAWQNSAFLWLRALATGTRGSAGRFLVEALLRNAGYTPRKAKGRNALAVGARVIRTKLSLEWATGEFVFEQIHQRRGTHLAMLGLRPSNDAFLWVCTEAQAIVISQQQHGPNSRWIRFPVAAPPASLMAHGGAVANASATLLASLGPPP